MLHMAIAHCERRCNRVVIYARVIQYQSVFNTKARVPRQLSYHQSIAILIFQNYIYH